MSHIMSIKKKKKCSCTFVLTDRRKANEKSIITYSTCTYISERCSSMLYQQHKRHKHNNNNDRGMSITSFIQTIVQSVRLTTRHHHHHHQQQHQHQQQSSNNNNNNNTQQHRGNSSSSNRSNMGRIVIENISNTTQGSLDDAHNYFGDDDENHHHSTIHANEAAAISPEEDDVYNEDEDDDLNGDDDDDDDDEEEDDIHIHLDRIPAGTTTNLLMLGAYVEPVTAEVTSKDVFEGVVIVNDDDNNDDNDDDDNNHGNRTRRGDDSSSSAKKLLRRRPAWLLLLSFCFCAIFVLMLIAVAVGVSVKFVGEGKDSSSSSSLSSKDGDDNGDAAAAAAPSDDTGGAHTTTTYPPSTFPTSAPTSPLLMDFIDDLRLRLRVPNADLLLQNKKNDDHDPSSSSPQYLAARWMTEVDQYQPLNDEDLLQRYALVVFYYSTKRGPLAWTVPCGFLDPTTHVCEWNCAMTYFGRFFNELLTPINVHAMGVYCPPPPEEEEKDNNNNNNITTIRAVTGIQLPANHLDGTVPAMEFGRLLSNLTFLNLSINRLTGYFDLGHLPPSMEHIAFVSNFFPTSLMGGGDGNDGDYGTIGNGNIGHLTNLQSLQLSSKSLTDLFPDDIPQDIQVLGSIPTEIGLLAQLKLIALEDVQLTSSSIPTELGRLTQMTHLALSYNALTGFVPSELAALTQLETLSLESNVNLKGTLEGLCASSSSSSITTTTATTTTVPSSSTTTLAPTTSSESSATTTTTSSSNATNDNGAKDDPSPAVKAFSSDCLLTTISCSCCQTCCRPNGDCQNTDNAANHTTSGGEPAGVP